MFAQGTLAQLRGVSAAALEGPLRDVVALIAYQQPEVRGRRRACMGGGEVVWVGGWERERVGRDMVRMRAGYAFRLQKIGSERIGSSGWLVESFLGATDMFMQNVFTWILARNAQRNDAVHVSHV